MQLTPYYEEFLRYHDMAAIQQRECNLGTTPYDQGTVKDPLMQEVHLYDVVERKYAGFTQIVLDAWYGDTPDHPYAHKLHAIRKPICESYTGIHKYWSLPEWLYVFIVHRVTGSGINYAKKPSGYSNTILPQLAECLTIESMAKAIRFRTGGSIYTSVGYQFPAFPKPSEGFRLGGDYYLNAYAPKLARDLADYLIQGGPKELRAIGHWMWAWNKAHGLRAYKFQYAAVVADIADFYPDLVDRTSHFFYGKNALECLDYLAHAPARGNKEAHFDKLMDKIYQDTGSVPYNAEDIACDFIRWIENYVRPGHDYSYLNRDTLWNSSKIVDHPYGRQKKMLELGLIQTFNALDVHPSDDYILKENGMSVEDYKKACHAP